ncbi:cupin domain-containing protein [Mycolicibacterium goodii]|uniref:cupin domain-containing protein n=1 Tax=Mycolicibacterium goodii TaxID=134601 RepID=UPI000B202FDF
MSVDFNVSLRHTPASGADLPAAQPKPTSKSNQMESSVDLWADGETAVGIWECGPGEFTADRTNATEVCHIVSGHGTVTGEDGASADIGPGSLLVLPRGWRGTWVIHDTIRKSYVLIDA